jgi:hypothetical protein
LANDRIVGRPPDIRLASRLDALIVLAAGDLSVLAWWVGLFVVVHRHPEWRWALFGPSLMTGIALITWIASAALAPFGRADLGASDAAKFLLLSGMSPWLLAAVLSAVAAAVVVRIVRYFRLPPSAEV